MRERRYSGIVRKRDKQRRTETERADHSRFPLPIAVSEILK